MGTLNMKKYRYRVHIRTGTRTVLVTYVLNRTNFYLVAMFRKSSVNSSSLSSLRV